MTNKHGKNNYFIQSALKEISLFRKHFHIVGQGDEVKVLAEISPLDVLNFCKEYFAFVRPTQLSSSKILPQADATRLRGLYLGQPDANILLNLIVRHCLYVDQIVLIDPFNDLPYNQIAERPAAWVEVLVNRALGLCALEEWIREEIVIVIPSLLYYKPELRDSILRKWSMLLPILTKKKVNEDYGKFMTLRLLLSVEEVNRFSVLDVLDKMGDKYSLEDKDELLSLAKDYEEKYPIRFRLNQEFYDKYFKSSQRGQIIDFSFGTSLLVANDIADTIGAFLIFEHQFIYQELSEIERGRETQTDIFQQLGISFQQLDFPFLHNVSLQDALMLRKKGYLSRFRVYLRDMWMLSSEKQNLHTLEAKTFDFIDRLKAEYSVLQQEWESIKSDLRMKAIASGVIIGLSAGAAFVFGNIDLTLSAVSGLGAGVIKENFLGGYSGTSERIKETRKQPLFVFLALEGNKK
ncbi:MAG: hypothetical protein HYZ25_05935 [Chloroflexi bacterium]|nr:hypothetical protein [Chloroflexota bacterium]